MSLPPGRVQCLEVMESFPLRDDRVRVKLPVRGDSDSVVEVDRALIREGATGYFVECRIESDDDRFPYVTVIVNTTEEDRGMWRTRVERSALY
jgi:hypothetical protein